MTGAKSKFGTVRAGKTAATRSSQILPVRPHKLLAFEGLLKNGEVLSYDEFEWRYAIDLAKEGKPLTLARLLRKIDAPPISLFARRFLADLVEGRPGIIARRPGTKSALTDDDILVIHALFQSRLDEVPKISNGMIIAWLSKQFPWVSEGTIRDVLDQRGVFAEKPR
ncbi:MAG: hypothetical protein EXR27_03420 [Betaproteobacteria bacterium]|nr:hypothetical protein [Betaproteobacteria bacterium]